LPPDACKREATVIQNKLVWRYVQGQRAKLLLGSFLITLAIGSREIKLIDGAKHVEPMAED